MIRRIVSWLKLSLDSNFKRRETKEKATSIFKRACCVRVGERIIQDSTEMFVDINLGPSLQNYRATDLHSSSDFLLPPPSLLRHSRRRPSAPPKVRVPLPAFALPSLSSPSPLWFCEMISFPWHWIALGDPMRLPSIPSRQENLSAAGHFGENLPGRFLVFFG